MLLHFFKSLWYYMPFKQYAACYRLRIGIYHRIIRRLMERNYGKIVTKEIHGIYYELDLSETIDSSLYYSGVFEIETLKCLQKQITPEMIVFEIGANIGSHSFEIAKLLQPGNGRLYCFEPTEYAFKKLCKNQRLNNFSNIVFEKIAFSDAEGTQRITPASSLDTVAFSASWDVKDMQSKQHAPQDITFKTLDQYVFEHEIQRVHLLKIDVDGYELKVIRGAQETIRRDAPIIIIEFSECLLGYVGDTLDELLSLLENRGYTFQPVYMNTPIEQDRLVQEVRYRQTLDCLCRCQH